MSYYVPDMDLNPRNAVDMMKEYQRLCKYTKIGVAILNLKFVAYKQLHWRKMSKNGEVFEFVKQQLQDFDLKVVSNLLDAYSCYYNHDVNFTEIKKCVEKISMNLRYWSVDRDGNRKLLDLV